MKDGFYCKPGKGGSDLKADIKVCGNKGDSNETQYSLTSTLPFSEVLHRSNLTDSDRRELLFLLDNHNVVLIKIGHTNLKLVSEISRYLYQAGWTNCEKMIACVESNRFTTTVTSISGGSVEFLDKFERNSSEVARKVYLTDDFLIREALIDPYLLAYSAILIDIRSQERPVNIDILLILLRKLKHKRNDLRIIIVLSEISYIRSFFKFFNATKESSMLAGTPATMVIKPLRHHCVKIFHLKQNPILLFCSLGKKYDHNSSMIMVNMAVKACITINREAESDSGDILVFLNGREEIISATNQIEEMGNLNRSKLKLMAFSLSDIKHKLIFKDSLIGIRRVIFASGFQASIMNFDGIKFVVDNGLTKLRIFDIKTGLNIFTTSPISRDEALKRASLAKTSVNGVVYRLYSKNVYEKFSPQSCPDIEKMCLSKSIVQLKSLGMNNILNQPYINFPSEDILCESMNEMAQIGLIDRHGNLVHPISDIVVDLSIDPKLAKIIVASTEEQFKCTLEIVSIVAVLASGPIFCYNDKPSQRIVSQKKFCVEEGDLITYLNVYQGFITNQRDFRWCRRNFVVYETLRKAEILRSNILKSLQHIIGQRHFSQNFNYKLVQKCICTGFFRNIAVSQPDGSYRHVRFSNTPLYIHPQSSLFRRAPKYVAFTEGTICGRVLIIFLAMYFSSRIFIHNLTVIEPSWILEMFPQFFKSINLS